MDIFQKIEQIREKPEHVRRRYVWFFVTVFMVLVIGVWAISLRSNFGSSNGIINEGDRLQMLEGVEEKNKIQENLPGDYEDYYYEELNKSLQNSENIQENVENNSAIENTQPTNNQESGTGVGQYDLLSPGQ